LNSTPGTAGEKNAAERAKERILERLAFWEREAPPIEYRFSMADMWSRRVFVALLRRYGIRPYRYSGQRCTTVMARVSKRFVDETLWPEFREISETLRTYLSEVTDRVVAQVIHQDSSEAELVERPRQLFFERRDAATAENDAAAGESAGGAADPSEAGQSSNGQGTGARTDAAEKREDDKRRKKKRKDKKRNKRKSRRYRR